MTARLGAYGKSFKGAMIFSAAAHSVLLLLIIANPSLPKPSSKGMIHYIPLNLVGMPGGGGGGGGGGSKAVPQKSQDTVTVKKETLRDLTTPQKLQEQPKSALRYPVDKPKKEPKLKPDKKATITKPDTSPKTGAEETTAAAGAEKGPGGGSGLTIGAGGPGYGEGSGMGLAGQIGLSSFPYVYYLQAVRDKISSRWFTSLVDPGITGTFQVAVYFRIFRNGTISTVEIRESSGIRTLDMSASRAVMTAAPFPPLPPEYDEEYLGIILIFEHSR